MRQRILAVWTKSTSAASAGNVDSQYLVGSACLLQSIIIYLIRFIGGRTQKTLRIIDGELKKLSRIVQGLFTLAMADAGELRLFSEPLYLNEVIEEVCMLVDARAERKHILVKRDLTQQISYTGDETFLHELFLILLDNAIKYSPANTIITVSVACDHSFVRAQVEDQGFGISEKDRPYIFDRFYRALQPGADDAHNGGLGLAIAQAITRAHGGSIEHKSELGVGSSFAVVLPIYHPGQHIVAPDSSRANVN